MTRLVVRLLGGYRVELDGETVYNFETDKARALLAYLVVEADRPHRRETLAGLLWPDWADAASRKSLRQALYRVKQALRDFGPPFFLFITPTDVQFNKASDYTLDVAELEALDRALPRDRGLLPEALCGDFLAGFSIPDSETFQAWALDRQEHYHRLALEVLDEQNAYFERIRDYDRAVEAARRQLQLEPWLEEAHRRCMRGLALAGRRDEALRQYEACCRVLEVELGAEPAAATSDLFGAIRAGKITDSETRRPGEAPGRPITASARPRASSAPSQLLVAREDELGCLAGHLEAALAGESSVAFVSGDPGSGKTALLDAFAAIAMAKHPDLLVAGARCSPGGSLNPFAPLLKLAEMLFGDPTTGVGWRPGAGGEGDRLQDATDLTLGALAEYGLGLVDTLVPAASVSRRATKYVTGRPAWWEALQEPLRGALENRPKPAGPPSQVVLFDQLVCSLAAIAQEQPLLLLCDDLQWVDDASAAFLVHVIRELSGARLLITGAYRPATVAMGRRDPASGEVMRHPLVAALNELRRLKGEIVVDLDRADGRTFVEAFIDTEPNRLGAPFRDALFAQTGGHALFTVETLRNLQVRGELTRDEGGRWVANKSLDWGALPVRVEAAIAERIDRLPEWEHRILSCAAVQGDDFAGEVVAEVAGKPAGEILATLSGSLARQHQLVRPEGLQRLTGGQQSLYRFTHHLFQKYLYDQLDPVERARMHSAIAASLDQQIAGDPAEREQQSARLAWHYEAAGLPLQAASALYDAGRLAMRLSANSEAMTRFNHGLALLAAEPPSDARTRIRRLLEVARLGTERIVSGPGSVGMAGTLAKAIEAGAADAEEVRPKLTLLSAQAERLYATGRTDESDALAQQMLDLAAQAGDEIFVALAHWRFGANHTITFDLYNAERHLGWALDWLTPERSAEVRAAIGLDLAAAALSYSAINRWFLGYPETGLARGRQSVAGAFERGSVYGLAFAAAMGADLMFLLRDEAAMVEQTEMCHRLSTQHGFGLWRVYAEVFLGRTMVLRGEHAPGIERMRGGVNGWQGAGMVPGSATLVLVFADTCLRAAAVTSCDEDAGATRAGLLATGLAMADSLLDPGKAWKDYGYLAELHRVRGELLLARDGLAAAGEAMQSFETAIGLARERDLLSIELRAAMSVVRLRESQGADHRSELAEARQCLAEVVARFTEGFGFPDLQDAAALMGA